MVCLSVVAGSVAHKLPPCMNTATADVKFVGASTVDRVQLPSATCAAEDEVVSLFRPVVSDVQNQPSSDGQRQHRSQLREFADNYAVESTRMVHTPNVSEKDILARFANVHVPSGALPVQEYLQSVMRDFVDDSTRVFCSKQIGHMAANLPYYMPPLAELVTAMNQNTVKVETAKTVASLERQVCTWLHRLVYQRDDAFYSSALENSEVVTGMLGSGGTVANITGLWVARNRVLGPDPECGFKGVEHTGLLRAVKHYGYSNVVVVGSELMHYSMKKATDLLGLGVQGLVTVPFDNNYRVRVDLLAQKVEELKASGACVVAIVGVAGATETGSIDDLDALANIAQEHGIHFHVDGAWGAPGLFSQDMRKAMTGIERADSVTVDGHKQLFVPMGSGVLLLKDPECCRFVAKTASYIIRKGSMDAGRFTLEGSRPGNAIYMHANMKCIGSAGFEMIVNRTSRMCRHMAHTLEATGIFEVVLQPQMNILLYRFVPQNLRHKVFGGATLTEKEYEALDGANVWLQETQKSDGRTFVSRTTVFDPRHGRHLVSLRVVIGNPLTDESDIDAVISDQFLILEAAR
eukprot:CAMPEP_0194552712 /NCGR_PEP_ID=MMETSP0253-20130528/96863_1 /TAXON_ID=2966 /ORGANISM="Noctiluca scintillans" /LENGTH=576 /DNA_ID=CAMNT_0039400185 /DNA_START=75 /DNA_END=1805 /DNA_ORIENTATION=+